MISNALAPSLEENGWIIQARSFCGDQVLPLSWKACLAFAMLARVSPGISRAKGQSCLDCIFQNPVNWVEFELLAQVFSWSIFLLCIQCENEKLRIFCRTFKLKPCWWEHVSPLSRHSVMWVFCNSVNIFEEKAQWERLESFSISSCYTSKVKSEVISSRSL